MSILYKESVRGTSPSGDRGGEVGLIIREEIIKKGSVFPKN